MLGIKDFIYRCGHNRGYGVQSPSAFHFVTAVVAEKYAYYAYSTINSVAAKCGYKAAHARLLFRIANYARPQNILMYAPCEAAACALSMARPSAQVSAFRQGQLFGLLYVGATQNCAPVVEQAVKCASADSVIIIDGIHRSREMKDLWHAIKQNAAVAVTFDLYSMGILFFDKSYKKQHYTLKK
ncbi:MAG: hypothetical protein E7089_01425 [Bacteroidales bacterium]|nr:hypothetical protein [Bacteroidales bacterium]